MPAFEVTNARPYPLIHFPAPWTTSDVARRLGVLSSAVRDWRQGLTRPSIDHLDGLLTYIFPSTSTAQRACVFMAYGYVPPGYTLLARYHPDILTAALEGLEASRIRRGSTPSLVGGMIPDSLAASRPDDLSIDVLELLQGVDHHPDSPQPRGTSRRG